MKPERAPVTSVLTELFDAERNVRRLHAELLKVPRSELASSLEQAVREALAESDEDEVALRLVRLASLLGELEGPKAVDSLIDILTCDEGESRHAAGEALEELAFERFKEVALGIERALVRLPSGSPALLELPYLLAGIGEPGVRKLLAKFLLHPDPEAVSAAIEAIVDMGDVGARPLLEPLVDDSRKVSLEDDEGEEGTVTLGELAKEAVKLLTEIEGPNEPVRTFSPKGKGGRH
jgi:HEAT repeat protein